MSDGAATSSLFLIKEGTKQNSRMSAEKRAFVSSAWNTEKNWDKQTKSCHLHQQMQPQIALKPKKQTKVHTQPHRQQRQRDKQQNNWVLKENTRKNKIYKKNNNKKQKHIVKSTKLLFKKLHEALMRGELARLRRWQRTLLSWILHWCCMWQVKRLSKQTACWRRVHKWRDVLEKSWAAAT